MPQGQIKIIKTNQGDLHYSPDTEYNKKQQSTYVGMQELEPKVPGSVHMDGQNMAKHI